ncbi:MAG: ABC transporter ATP-binding protein [Oscillospiraceae bacterium]|nr:ABC transporter ATP-binding protein [Oscillospiraceae bacterium]
MDSILTAKGLTKKYSKFTLGGLDFELPKGFATALIGANGAGKTTLIDMLCGVTLTTSGEVEYFGQSKDINDPAIRERIGYCASSGFFPQGWRAKDIAISMEIAYKSFDRKKFAQLCEQLEVDSEHTKKAKPMYKQSDGNRMRTALASVFARDTELLILDEPGSSLDPLMRDRLCDRMREYLDDGDGEKSILFSTHNIADMENAADYAIFMDNGKIIEQGFVEELKEKYIIARGAAEDYDKAQHLLMSHSKNRTVFDGLALAEHTEELAKLGVDSEAPTLQQLSIGLLKYAEETR